MIVTPTVAVTISPVEAVAAGLLAGVGIYVAHRTCSIAEKAIATAIEKAKAKAADKPSTETEVKA